MAATSSAMSDTHLIRGRQWWQLRSPRERWAWIASGALVLALAAWALLWRPLMIDTERLERRLAEQRTVLATARLQADEIGSLARKNVEAPAVDAKAAIESALSRMGLKATAIDRTDDGRTRVTLDAVPFDALLALLDGLQRDARLTAADVTVAGRVEPGQVRGEMSFFSPR